MKKVGLYALVGIGIGMIWTCVGWYLAKAPNQSLAQISTVVVVSALMGIASLIYEFRGWSLLTCSLLHAMTVFSLTVVMIQLNGWLDFTTKGQLLSFFVEFMGIYVVIYLFLYFSNRKKAQVINQKLAEKKLDK